MGTCLECEEIFDLTDEMDVSDIVVCPNCHARLEILDLDPVTIDYAEEEAEEG